MVPLRSGADIVALVQHAKDGATEFHTNFFPVERKVQAWIDHDELMGERREGVSFLVRRDRDFAHLFYCASALDALARELARLPAIERDPLVVDLIGRPETLQSTLRTFEAIGFREYRVLNRLSRVAAPLEPPRAGTYEPRIDLASAADSRGILELLEEMFDPYGEQVPVLHEIEAAVAAGQILLVKHEGVLAALLFFETLGLTSTVRFWGVGARFRALRLGSALMRHYLAMHAATKRFVLWVTASNHDAIEKYRHYGYTADGLVDYVLANRMISHETTR